VRYSEKAFPPLSKEEYEYFKDALNENLNLYSGDDALYLRQYIIWEMLRLNGKDCYMLQNHLDKLDNEKED
tara:strand:+ start:608 stop:820 length:213 start_codon:yes stop_codon:yes gene_type:complete